MHKIQLGVLPEDEVFARQLDATCTYSFLQARSARKAELLTGDSRFGEQARLLDRDYENALRELKVLRDKKDENDRIVSMVQDLKNRGIEVTKIERMVLHVR